MTHDGGKPTTLVARRDRPGLSQAFGVEIELMIVDAETLDVKPVCDRLMEVVAGAPVSDVELGPIAWSNELTLHVLELKTNGPAAGLSGLAGLFHESALFANRTLADLGATLMPGAMHPWMNPATETRLWPHEYSEVYHTFDRIFGCSGHGWSNLQSTHLNLPFTNDEEFARLHAAVRIVLPLIPALAAASPFMDGMYRGSLDGRMAVYRDNARTVPSVSGRIIPEAVFSRDEYDREILQRIYSDMAPMDPEGVVRHEWVNARGAIARFDRGAIEIRVIDAQECPAADLAIVAAVSHLVRSLAQGRLSDRDVAADPSTESLALLLDRAIVEGNRATVHDATILDALGLGLGEPELGEVWKRLLDADPIDDPFDEWVGPLQTILEEGPLARRILSVTGQDPSPADLRRLASDLCDCLSANVPFRADANR